MHSEYVLSSTSTASTTSTLDALCIALEDTSTSPQDRLQHSVHVLNAIDDAIGIESLIWDAAAPKLLRVYELSVALLRHIACFRLNTSTRHRAVAHAESISIRPILVSHTFLVMRYLERALELIEEGRGIFWTQALALRDRYDDVPEPLRIEMLTISGRLERESHGSDLTEAGSESLWYNQLDAERLGQLIQQVRALPGRDRFLLPETATTLAHAAVQGPVVLLTVGKTASYALILRAFSSVQRVELPHASAEWLKESARLWGNVSDARHTPGDSRKMLPLPQTHSGQHGPEHVLRDLWTKVVYPVIDALGLKPRTGFERTRIWWIPTGFFNLLPLHAAGTWRKTRSSSLSAYAVSSYAPTIHALLAARETYRPVNQAHARVLLGAVPHSAAHPSKRSLPHALQELRVIRAHLPEHSLLNGDTLEDGLSTHELLYRLPDAHVLHLACHGEQNIDEPLQSNFILRDGAVKVADFMPFTLPRAVFAFLGACETAKGDEARPDQFVHLAATMLFVGFKSVIATMWDMNDKDGPLVSSIVYRQLFSASSEHLNLDLIPYALDDAVQELREKGVSPGRWATYIHLGI